MNVPEYDGVVLNDPVTGNVAAGVIVAMSVYLRYLFTSVTLPTSNP